MKRALVIGINDYATAPLASCVNDAAEISNLLARNGDGSPNFHVKTLTSDAGDVTTEIMTANIEELFQARADTALLYFSGHGLINPQTNAGYIVSQNGTRGAWGPSLTDILTLANGAHPRIQSTVIILDSCHSGAFGEVPAAGNTNISVIGNGVTILTASHRDGAALAGEHQSVFTSMLIDGLYGSASDICGRITPASVYSHIDQALGAWGQRPVYKANVETFITLRQVPSKVPMEVLRKLPQFFPQAAYEFPLDPAYEPDRKNIPEEFRHLPVDPAKTAIFKELQMCNRHGLVVPVNAEHMYDAAINSTACKLTALGAHYRHLAEAGHI